MEKILNIPKSTKERGEAFRQKMLVDLAARGLGDSDIVGIVLEKDVDSADPRVILAWRYLVDLATGDRLTYSHSNEDGAAILCNDRPLIKLGEA